MMISVNSETLKAAYATIVNQNAKLTRMGQGDQQAIASLALLEQALQQSGEYAFLQEMKLKIQNPWSN